MCFFITVAVPTEQQVDLVETMGRELHVSRTLNPSVLAAFGQGYDTFLLTDRGCSCTLFRHDGDAPDRLPETDKLRRKHERKGWSAAKIERALASAANVSTPKSFEGLRFDVRISVASVVRDAGKIGLLVHWYGGAVEEEQVRVKGVHTIRVDDLLEDDEGVKPEEVVWIRR